MQIATVLADGLTLRSDANSRAKPVDILTRGDKLSIEEQEGKWRYGKVIGTRSGQGIGQVGWVHGDYIKIEVIPDVPPVEPRMPDYAAWKWAIGSIFVAAVLFLIIMQVSLK